MSRLKSLVESLGVQPGMVFDILTVATLVGTLAVGAVIGVVLINPNSALNPFPPATLPAAAQFPTPTATSEFPTLPPAWTPTPTFTATLTFTPSLTPTDTPTPTETFTPSPTDTPTFTATATRTPSKTPTATPPTSPTPVPTAAPKELSSRGIVGNDFWIENPVAGVGADVWFNLKVTNTGDVPVAYGALAAHTDSGPTAQSFTNSTLNAHQVLEWRDHINFNAPGTYEVYLGVCYADRDACLSGAAAWDRLSASITVLVQ